MEGGTVATVTNHCGGILGGITNGMPLVFRAAIKPTPSISRQQQSVSLSRGEAVPLVIQGRHDPCIVPRAVPVVEAAAAIALMDLLLDGRL
jgi:chorismate synthase